MTDNAQHSLTTTDGRFSFEGLPAGTYLVTVWHEELGESKEEVVLSEGEQYELSFKLSPG